MVKRAALVEKDAGCLNVVKKHLLKASIPDIHPSADGMREGWGEKSGTREYLRKRNMEIRARFRAGSPIDRLTEVFCLSYDSIKKIVYSR